jgi:ABC-type bacteriocin/lantibiotic exporter with double-glycine peptidase domain
MKALIAALMLVLWSASGASGATITLDVPKVTQKTIAWCWLAVAEMVVKYYGWDEVPSQCRILERIDGLPKGYCCGAVNRCVRTGHLEEIRRIINHYTGGTARITGPPRRASAIARALRQDHLIIAALSTGMGAGHVVVVRGIRTEQGRVEVLVNDPMSRIPQTIALSELRSYWSHTIIVHGSSADESDDDDDD